MPKFEEAAGATSTHHLDPRVGPASASLRAGALARLKDDILSCRRLPGATINEKDVAAELGISKTPVREAITQLTSEGFVEVYPRQGTIVRQPSLRDIKNVLLVRQLVEPEVSFQAALRATDSDIELLHELDHHQMSGTSQWLNLPAHAHFHIAIAEVARIPQLTTVVRAMQEQMRWFLACHAHDGGQPWPKHNHAELVGALTDRDAERAKSITEQSIAMSRANFLQRILVD